MKLRVLAMVLAMFLLCFGTNSWLVANRNSRVECYSDVCFDQVELIRIGTKLATCVLLNIWRPLGGVETTVCLLSLSQ